MSSVLAVIFSFFPLYYAARTERDLVAHILQNYDNRVRPVKDPETVIEVTIQPQIYSMIDVDELREQIRILLWFPQSWNDDYLKWNESEWSNITQINLPATTVWIPDGHIFNTVSSEEVLPLSSTNARISSSGKVEVDFNKLLDVRCVLRVLEFPFDSQECALQFGSWSYQTHQLVHNAKPTFVPEINENSEWDILAFNTEKIRKKYPTTTGEEIEYEEIFFKLMIKRKPLYYVVVFIIPSFLIVAVSIAGLFIPSTAGKERQEKLNLGLTTLLTLSIMLGMIASEMPKSAEGLPLLGRFVIAETALSIIAMTVSALILCWNERTASNEEKPPEWMLRALGDPDTNAELLDADLTLARSRHASVGEEQSPLIMKNNGNVRSLSSVFGGGPIHEQLAFLFRYYSEKKRAEYYENVWHKFFTTLDLTAFIVFQILHLLLSVLIFSGFIF